MGKRAALSGCIVLATGLLPSAAGAVPTYFDSVDADGRLIVHPIPPGSTTGLSDTVLDGTSASASALARYGVLGASASARIEGPQADTNSTFGRAMSGFEIAAQSLQNSRLSPCAAVRRTADIGLTDQPRRTASMAAAGGLSLPMIGALLGHTQHQTTARYAHLAADPLRQAANVVGQKILGATKGAGVNVINLPRR